MKKFIFYMRLALNLFLDDLKNMDILFHNDASDERIFYSCKVSNIKKCRKWSTIIMILFIVFLPEKDTIGAFVFGRISDCVEKSEYFYFLIYLVLLFLVLFLLIFALKLAAYCISCLFCVTIAPNE